LCGRFSVQEEYIRIARNFGLYADTDIDDNQSSDFNRSPGDMHPLVIAERNYLCLTSMKWGISDVFRKMLINARDDRIFSSKLWSSIYGNRCAVPVTGWWEWDAEKRIHHFSLHPKSSIFFLAGLHRNNQKTQVREFVIITTEAVGKLREYHERMPLCLDSGNFRQWLTDKSYSIRDAAANHDSFSFHHIPSDQSKPYDIKGRGSNPLMNGISHCKGPLSGVSGGVCSMPLQKNQRI
jgi:putative SOS response-associated peptidase YedK